MQIISEDHVTVSCDRCVQSTKRVQTKCATLSETQHLLRSSDDTFGNSPSETVEGCSRMFSTFLESGRVVT